MLATMVRDLADVRIVDAFSLALSLDETVSKALEHSPDIVGISVPFSFSGPGALAIAERLKSARPDVKVMVGGVGATSRPGRFLNHPVIDALAFGEAEHTLVETVKRVLTGGWNAVVSDPPAGLGVVAGPGAVLETEPRPLIERLDTLPMPAFDLLPGFPDRYGPRLITSRGCTYRCPYCASAPYSGRRFRAHSPRRVLNEVLALKRRWGISRLSFSDDTFNLDRRRARDIAGLFIETKLGIKWGSMCRPELLTEDDLRLYVKAGMSGLFMGLESGSPRVLEGIDRLHDLDKTRDLVRLAENLGVEVHTSFMIGLPDEREEDIKLTLEYAGSLPARTLGFHIFHPLPGSEYGESPAEYGIEFEIADEEMQRLGDIDGVAPIRTKYLSSMQILDYYHRARGIADSRRTTTTRDR